MHRLKLKCNSIFNISNGMWVYDTENSLWSYSKKNNMLITFLKSMLSVRLNNGQLGSKFSSSFEFINIVSIFCHIYIEFILLIYTVLVIYFAWYKE